MIKNLTNHAPKVGFRFLMSLLLMLVAVVPGFAARFTNVGPEGITLQVGDSFTPEIKIDGTDGNISARKWESKNPDIAVFENGTVTAVSPGETTITVWLGTGTAPELKSLTCVVNVEAAEAAITLNETAITLKKGESTKLVASVTNAPEGYDVYFITNDRDVVAAQNDGTIEALNVGIATVTAELWDANGIIATATCEVTVEEAPAPAPVYSISLNEEEIELVKGETFDLKATPSENKPEGYVVVFESSDPEVASVNGTGLVAAVGEGEATITAKLTLGDEILASASCKVSVKAAVVKEIILPLNSVDVKIGASESIPYALRGIEPSELKWVSMNKEIATVDAEGNVTGVSEGSVQIMAFTGDETDPQNSATCMVNVVKNAEEPVYSISLNKTELVLTVGETSFLIHTVSQNRPDGYYVLYESSDRNVVTVNATGGLKAISEGTATITAKLCKGTKTLAQAQCSVTVEAKAAEPSINFNETSVKLFVGNDFNLTEAAIIKDAPDGAYIMWSSENVEVASVDVNGVVRGVSAGSTTIEAKLMKGTNEKASAKIEIVVVKKPNDHSIILSESYAKLQLGETLLITPILRGSYEEGKKGEVKWISSDESVATVGLNTGVVTAVGEGTATIKALWVKGTHTYAEAECEIEVVAATVAPEPASIVLEKSSADLTEGETTQIVAIGHNLTEDIKFLSMDKAIATVDEFGLVTAVAEGETTILVYTGPATIVEGETVYQEFEVKVTAKPAKPVYSISLNVEEAALTLGDVLILKSTVSDNRPDGYYVYYSSSDKNIAVVNATGTVSGVGEGTATITAALCKGTETLATATCVVTIVAPVVDPLISFDSESYGVTVGKSLNLNGCVSVSDKAPEKSYIMWLSSNVSVATVNVDGVVTAVGEGTAKITANLMKGTQIIESATCEISVSAAAEEVKPSVSLELHEATLYVGKSMTLKFNVENAPKGYHTFFRSSNKDIVFVNRTGVAFGMSVGTATVTIELCKGTEILATDECVINVEAEVASISVSPAEATVTTDQTIQLVAEVEGEESADETLVWASNNEAVATVSENGLVTPVAPGVATITATTANNLTSFSVITVTNQTSGVEGVDFDNASVVTVGNDIIVPEGAMVYNMNGVIVNPVNLASGVYIVRLANGKAVKVVI